MNEEMINEMRKAAELLGMTEEDAMAKFEDICSKNNVNASEEPLLARGLWRQYFASARNVIARNANNTEGNTTTSSGSFYKSAYGFFVSLDEAIDMGEIQRKKVVAEYNRDSDVTYNMGKIALFTEMQNEDNDTVYEGQLMFEGEEKQIVVESLPDNNVQLDNGQWLVPINTLDAEWNKKNYGKPLPKTDWRRAGVFIGEVDGTMGKYFFSYRGKVGHEDAPVNFAPPTFEYLHFTCTLNQNNSDQIHGAVSKTVDSLVLNADLPDDSDMKRDITGESMQDTLMEYTEGNYSPLIDLEAYHNMAADKTYNDKFVFTDGAVMNINMEKTSNGNRIVTVDDLTTDMGGEVYGEEAWGGVTCWVPEHVDINFGIGSNIIVVGRTSQGQDDEGNILPVTINVTGLLPVNARGESPEDIVTIEEDESEWVDL